MKIFTTASLKELFVHEGYVVMMYIKLDNYSFYVTIFSYLSIFFEYILASSNTWREILDSILATNGVIAGGGAVAAKITCIENVILFFFQVQSAVK